VLGRVERLVVVRRGEPAHPRQRDPGAGPEENGVGGRKNEDLVLGECSTPGQVRLLHAAPESLRVDVIARR
jgi:hypothetical protein